MIAPGKHIFTYYANTTFRKQFAWHVNDAPVDLTGFTAKAQFRAKIDSPNSVLDLSTENDGIIIVSAIEGVIELYASAIDAAKLTADKYVYDINLTGPDGDTFRLVEGHVNIVQGVTK